jgi:hypothetical protein
VLFIDTATNQYYIQLKGLAKVNVEKHLEELIRIKLKITFLSFYFYPLRKKSSPKAKKLIEKSSVNKRKRIRKIFRMLRSFKVKRFLIDIDTGDSMTNVKLYPFYGLLNYNTGIFNINYEGKNRMVLYMENRPLYIIKSFIKN